MKKVLIVSYQFPPFASPGVQRVINLVNYLPKFGYEPIVLTLKKEDLPKIDVNSDASLEELILNHVDVRRVDAYPLNNFMGFLMKLKIYRIFWFFFYPLLWEWSFLWSIKTVKKARQIIEEEKINLVYTSSAPFSTMVLGYLLKRRTKVKWVADLRDPFTDAYVWQFPTKLHWYLARIFERWLFSKPDVLVVNTAEVKKLYLSRELRSENDIIVINNGY